MNNLRQTFLQALKAENIGKKEFAERHKLHPSEVSRFINGDGFCRSLKACIFKGWKSEATAIALFDSYIQDEMDAAGLSLKIKYEPK